MNYIMDPPWIHHSNYYSFPMRIVDWSMWCLSPAAPEVCVQGEGCIYQWVEHVREALATGTEGADVSAGDACAASEVEAGGQLWCHEWNEDKTELKGLKRVMIAC